MARAGRFGTKGLAITFVSDENDAKVLNDVQDRFEVNITGLPEEIDISSYSKQLKQCLRSMLRTSQARGQFVRHNPDKMPLYFDFVFVEFGLLAGVNCIVCVLYCS